MDRNDLWQITCLTGEYNNAGVCTLCPAGTYSTSYNVTSCTPCAAGTYSTTVGASASTFCLACPTGSTSTAGSTSCNLIMLSADSGTNTNVPARRWGASLDYDNNGGFFVFGGTNVHSTSAYSSLWRYNRNTSAFSFIDGSNSTNVNIPGKPSARGFHASWLDSAGNLWIFGGRGLNETGTTFGLLSDTWVYNVSSLNANKWSFVAGSKVVNERLAGTLEPRYFLGSWRDAGDNNLYLFGGYGITVTGGGYGNCKFVYFCFLLHLFQRCNVKVLTIIVMEFTSSISLETRPVQK